MIARYGWEIRLSLSAEDAAFSNDGYRAVHVRIGLAPAVMNDPGARRGHLRAEVLKAVDELVNGFDRLDARDKGKP